MNIGDVVYLKSGGIPMTVTEILQDGKIGAHWQFGAQLMGATFPADALTADDPGPAIVAASAAVTAALVAQAAQIKP